MVYDLISVIILLFLGGTPERRNLLVYDFTYVLENASFDLLP